MRRLPTLMIGTLALAVALVPTAAMAETLPTPTATTAEPTVSASAPAPTATLPSEPTLAPTATPEPSTSAGPAEPVLPGDPEEDFLAGKLSLKPKHGKPGTVTTISSKTNCVDEDGQVGPKVDVIMFTLDELDADGPSFERLVSTDAKGAWTLKAKVPASAKTGDVYYVIAGCFAKGVEIDEDAEPFMLYDLAEFIVTAADKAPVADPVPGDPDYTG